MALGADLDDPPPIAELSVPQMGRVLRNLLDNAIRHTPAGGTVTVSAAIADTGTGAGAVAISVDDGCGGIPAGDLSRVFELAFRGDAARTPQRAGDPPGGGIGLAVARGLVEAQGGTITVHNTGVGCRFTIRLPAVPGRRQR